MSKHFSIFQTEAQFNAAAESLDYPHVSLIETTGELKYFKFEKKELYNAPLFSIVLADLNNNNNLFWLTKDDYNTTEYPAASYMPIAICIKTSAEANHKNAVFMSLYCAKKSSPYYYELNTYTNQEAFGLYNVNLTSYGWNSQSISSKTLNDGLKEYIKNNNVSSNVLTACWNFALTGTEAGDWMLPSYYDCTSIKDNWSSFKTAIEYYILSITNQSNWNTSKFGSYVYIGYSSNNAEIAAFRIVNASN